MTADHDEPASASAPDGVRILTLSGRLSAAHARTVGDTIVTAAAEGKAVVIDLSRVELIDASIARTLRTTLAQCERRGTRTTVAGATGQPLEVLEILGMAKDLGALRTLDEAVAVVIDPAGAVASGGDSIETRVHRLLTTAHALPDGDPHRRRLESLAVEAALPLARTMALRYRQRGEPLDDLIQVAALGVVRAVQGYDSERGSGFLAYAVPTVLGELRRHFRDHGWTVRPPRRIQELRPVIAKATAELTQELGAEPGLADIADRLGVDLSEVESAVISESGLRPLSLDAPTATNGDRVLYDMLGASDPDMELTEFRVALAPLIATLPALHRKVLTLRFGADLTQQEIADRLGTSQMNVSRILSSLMGRFRRALLAEA